jgi:hypothetical protein
MATRSTIAVKTKDNAVRSIYCHYDGYPEHMLPTLKEHYTDAEKIIDLIELGDISYLAEEVGTEKQDFESPTQGITLAYGRDRGETGVDTATHTDLEGWLEDRKESWCVYGYLWTGTEWEVFDLED